ncbi:Stk1 family PASTA domain-containing Ser/Thr kinase [Streptomyces sp. 8L]|uniref:Stk1 family PASTA domain-containing Ser/Thr kinase n=1 Tax=Streptomyces sp. 8L TaxID=2877242 RepID=UPI001CD3B192|nr:Stk1 family PASTA domain-containing Ser/Thr kinase [Streptomyces sp. 8L]MCA1221185.1 Stk1 family PASTA domain-containing Ser/Thr kinase [Streptomyces sp. 8L]
MDTTLNDPMVGQVVDGRYRVDARIAVGGMATVYRALDTRLDRVLALKVMHPALAADAGFVERFIREAKSVARLAHPNVVAVFDQGAEGAYVYLAMEYVAGCTLRDVLRERGALQPRAALDIVEPVLAALGAAHRAGFVHRDMKPENVLIGDDGRVKVADFGLVRAVDDVTTSTGAVLGTVSYLAPEQLEDAAAGAGAGVDVYACGVVLYETLTGRKPHGGETPAQVLYQHLNEDVPAPSAAVPGLAPELDALVAAATARDPRTRPRDAVELLALAHATRAALSDAQLDSLPPAARAASGTSGSENRTSVIPRTAPASRDADRVARTSRLDLPPAPPAATGRGGRGGRFRRRRRALAVLAALVAVLIGVGVWYIDSGQFTRVPSLLGQSEQAARKRLSDAGLDARVDRGYSDAFDRGTVMRSDPAPETRVRGSGPVTLTISRGPRIVSVPRLAGLPLADAKAALAKAGLAAGLVTTSFDDGTDRGAVISSDPGAGERVRPGKGVALKVSRGSAIDVPDVTGEDVDDATSDLADAGLKAKVAPARVESSEDAGDVARQSPGEGGQLAEGDTVTLTVSKGPKMVTVPDVTGRSADDARERLEDAGFKVKVKHSFPFIDDTITDQSVDGGDKAPEGSTVTIKTDGL